MDALKSSFLPPLPFDPSPKPAKTRTHKPRFLCSIRPDPWSPRDSSDSTKAKPKSRNPKSPLSDDHARRIIKAKAQYLSVLRRNQGSRAQAPKWIKRTPEQMLQYLEDDRHGHLYGRHVVAAIKRVRSLSAKAEGSYNMREVMGSFVAKLTFKEMCVVLKEQKSWRQVRDFFGWMKLQLSYRPSIISYTIVLRAYGQIGKIRLAEETFLEMLEAGCEPDEVACGTMLCSYAKWGRHKAMLTFYSAVQERGINPSTPVFNFMLSSLQKKSLHKHVVYVWRQMVDKGVIPNHFTYTVVIRSLVTEGHAEEALKTFYEMKNFGMIPEEATYSLLISLCSRRGDRDEAFSLYDDMRSREIVPSNFTCASLLRLYYKNEDYSKALSLFSEMESHGVAADEVIHGLLIRIYGKLGLYEDAQKTFEDIERLGLLSDERTYTTMAIVHLNYGNFEEALDIMERMTSSKILLSRFSYTVLLQCYVMKEDLTSAEVTYQALSQTGIPDASSCNDMLNLYLRLGLMEKAKDFIAHVRKDQVAFDEALVKTVMKVYCTEGMLMDAEELLKELRSRGTFERSKFVQSLSMVMSGELSRWSEAVSASETLDQSCDMVFELLLMLCLANRSSKMQEKLKLLLKTKKGESAANRVICKLMKEENVSNAEYLYQLMIKFGHTIEDSASSSMISLYGKQHRLKEAHDIFARVIGSPATGEALYISMIDAYIRCSKEEDAYLFYTEHMEKGHDLGPVAISILVNALAKSGKYHKAEDVIHTSFRTHMVLDTVAYNTFIKAMLEAGKLHFAVSIYKRMLFNNISPSIQTYNMMISVYGRGQKLDKAIDIFNGARSMGMTLDEKIYTNMIFSYGKAGKSREASALFCQMQEEGIKPGKVLCDILINIYAAEGLYREAELIFGSMQKNCSPDASTYLALIQAYSKGLKYTEAEKTIIVMQKTGISPCRAHYNLLLVAFTRAGLMREAERFYETLISTGLDPNLESNQTMLRGYLNFGHVEEGINFFERNCFTEQDNFILSAAVHLYKSASMELKAKELLNSMNNLGVPLMNNLEVRSETSPSDVNPDT